MVLRLSVSLAILQFVVTNSGCAPIGCCTHHCGCAIDSVMDGTVLGCCGCSAQESCHNTCHDNTICHCPICRGGGLCPLARHHQELRIAVGPPAIRHQPEMPPEFLPVPPYPVFAKVNMQAPTEVRGSVEAGYGPELTIQGRD